MYKIILVVCLVFAGANAGVEDVNKHANNSATRNDDFINLNKFHQKQTLAEYDSKLTEFENHYAGRVETINVQRELVIAALVQNNERLNPFSILGSHFKRCVVKYRPSIPTVVKTHTAITACVEAASSQITAMLKTPLETRNKLENYYKNSYEKHIEGCAEEYDPTSADYTHCVTSVTAIANAFSNNNKKLFVSHLEAAECTAKANINKALDCSFTEQTRVISLISEANLLTKNCFDGKDECKPCEEYTCSESYDLEVDSKSQTIENPFYGRENNSGCLILNAH